MADGESRVEIDEVKAPEANIWRQIKDYRHTQYILWACASAACLVTVVFAHTFSGLAFLASADAKLYFLAACAGFLLPVLLLFRDLPDNLAHGPSWKLPTFAMLLLAGLTAIVCALAWSDPGWRGPSPWKAEFALIFSMLALVYVSLLWNAVGIWRFAERERLEVATARMDPPPDEIRDADQRDAEAVSALISTFLVAAVITLAFAAGKWGQTLDLQEVFGIGLGFTVISVFAVVIFVEPLSKLAIIGWLARNAHRLKVAGRPFAALYNGIDFFFVRIGAVVAGMEHRNIGARYLLLGGQLVCLCLLGWNLPSPYGLIPCALGIVIAISVSRLWSWVEDDRALALLTDFNPSTPFRTKMREDFRDETLLGFIFVFILIPIIMFQANDSKIFGPEMFKVPVGHDGFLSWAGFFGIELAKAVPIVDWAEIYQIQANGAAGLITMNSVASRHAVFLARATVDLVLIASLLQAISISNRNRQQKQLYRAGASPENWYKPGLIDRLDRFVEEAELKRAIPFCRRDGSPEPSAETGEREAHESIFDLKRLSDAAVIDFRRYNADRLLEIYGQSNDAMRRAFIAAIAFERPDLTLKSRLQLLEEFAEQGRGESELYAVLERLISDHAANPQRANLSLEPLRTIMLSLKNRSGLKEFKHRLLDLMAQVGKGSVAIEFFADIAGRSDPDQFQYTKVRAVEKILGLATSNHDLRKSALQRLKEVIRSDPGPRTVQAAKQAIARIRELNNEGAIDE